MTCVKVKNDVDNSVDNVENVMWYVCFYDASSLKIAKKISVILEKITRNVKKSLIFREIPGNILTE